MSYNKIICFLYILLCSFLLSIKAINNKPVIGILAQKYYGNFKNFGDGKHSYIAASYVKYLESSGARVAVINIGGSKDYYNNILSRINGVLFPGGGQILNESDYGRVGKIIFEYAKNANEKGDYFPIWGICLGMEMLFWLNGGNLELSNNSWNLAGSTHFLLEPTKTRMFQDVPENYVEIMTKKPVFIHFHHKCINPSESKANISIISTQTNHSVDIFEFNDYPFYGVIFHPEKPAFEIIGNNQEKMNIPHDYESILISQYLSNFFVNETRKNNHRWEGDELIYNYSPEFTGSTNSHFQQMYFFKYNTSNENFDELGELIINNSIENHFDKDNEYVQAYT